MREYIALAKEIALSKNGECLSEHCPTTKTKLLFRCSSGHEWITSFGNVKYHERWCRKCIGIKQRNTIKDAVDLAITKNGICLSQEYINNHTKLKWQCSKGHVFYSSFNKISSGRWCAKCSKKKKHTIEYVKKLAKSRGGQCLSDQYISLKSNLLWKCAKEHVWSATFNNIKNHNKWCPHCKTSKGQAKILKVLKKVFPHYNIHNNYRKFSWLKTDKWQKQELDIYIEDIKLAIEYDGIQHFEPVHFGGHKDPQENLLYIQKLDNLKNKKIASHPEDVRYFIRFNYLEKLTYKNIINKLISSGILME